MKTKTVEIVTLVLLLSAPHAEVQTAEPSFAFPNDSLGRMEREQLVPPVYLPASPVPYATGPRPWSRPTLDQSLGKQSLPLAIPSPAPRLTEQDQGSQIARLPAYDQPPLALESDLPHVAPVWLPSPALAYASSPKADSPQPPAPRRLLIDKPPTAAQDPVEGPARIVALPLAGGSRTPAPLLLHAIPDPDQRIEEVRLRQPPPDNDAPATSSAFPARPDLPTEKAAP